MTVFFNLFGVEFLGLCLYISTSMGGQVLETLHMMKSIEMLQINTYCRKRISLIFSTYCVTSFHIHITVSQDRNKAVYHRIINSSFLSPVFFFQVRIITKKTIIHNMSTYTILPSRNNSACQILYFNNIFCRRYARYETSCI